MAGGGIWGAPRGRIYGSVSCKWNQLFGIVLLALQSTVAQNIVQFQGKLVVLNAPRRGQQLVGQVSYHFRTYTPNVPGESLLYTLVLGPNVVKPDYELKTGDPIQLYVDLDQSGWVYGATGSGTTGSGAPGTLFVWAWSAVSFGGEPSTSSQVYYTGYSQLALRTVVWVVTSVCGEEVAGGMTAEDVSEAFFGPPPGAALRSPGPAGGSQPLTPLNRLWDSCSYGAVRLKQSDVLIMNVSLPCNGARLNGAAWSADPATGACGTNELWGWMEHAALNAQQVLAVDLSPYRRRMLVLPPGSSSPLCQAWQQHGSYGCDESAGCDMWIKADRTRLLQWSLTQMGSSMMLQPATQPPAGPATSTAPQPPTDPSDPMGSSQLGEYRCFNGLNSYKLLFSQPARRLDRTNTFLGSFTPAQLPAAATNPANLLLLVPNWVVAPAITPPPLYGQYRMPVGGDAGLAASVHGRVTLHWVNSSGTVAGTQTAGATRLLALLQPGESYRYEAAKVVVRFASVAPSNPDDHGGVTGGGLATVTACRYVSTTETGGACYDAVDNDCDGLVDFDDPDCTAAGRHH